MTIVIGVGIGLGLGIGLGGVTLKHDGRDGTGQTGQAVRNRADGTDGTGQTGQAVNHADGTPKGFV